VKNITNQKFFANFMFMLTLVVGLQSCSKKTARLSKSVASNPTDFTETLDALTLAEKQDLAEVFGFTLEEFQKRLDEHAFTVSQLRAFADVLKKSRQLKISFNFSTENMSYTPGEPASNLPCYRSTLDSSYGFPGKDYVVDKDNPTVDTEISTQVLTDQNNVPTQYIFSAKISDRGCGANRVSVKCSIYNYSADVRRNEWINGGNSAEDFPVPYVNILQSNFACYGPDFGDDEISKQKILQVFASARPGDTIHFKIQAFDGALEHSGGGNGNPSGEKGVVVPIYKQIIDSATLHFH
jgi:hypothetical protein